VPNAPEECARPIWLKASPWQFSRNLYRLAVSDVTKDNEERNQKIIAAINRYGYWPELTI